MHQLITFLALAAAQGGLSFALHDTDGVVHRANEWAQAKAVVVFFTTTDCPLSNGYIPEMKRIRDAYGDRGVAFYGVQTDTTIRQTEVRKHAKDFAIAFPVLL